MGTLTPMAATCEGELKVQLSNPGSAAIHHLIF